MNRFTINSPTQVHFGQGVSQELGSVLDIKAGPVVLVRGASGLASQSLEDNLGALGYELHRVIIAQEPTVSAINAAFAQCKTGDVQAVIACGGGSVIDAGKALTFCLNRCEPLPSDFSEIDPKALAQHIDIPLIAVPTTAGTGAEVTSNAVLGTSSAKVSLRGRSLFPRVALVDPDLLRTAPKSVIIGSGIDAIVQTMEAYTSSYATPFSDALTAPNLTLGVQALRAVVESDTTDAWSNLAWVSLSSGLALANGGLGAAHGLASVIGGRHDAPHGLLCGRLLGPVLLRNREVAEAGSTAQHRVEACINALSTGFPTQDSTVLLAGFYIWLDAQNVPRLRDFSLKPTDFADIAKASVMASSSTKNAVPPTLADFKAILEDAY